MKRALLVLTLACAAFGCSEDTTPGSGDGDGDGSSVDPPPGENTFAAFLIDLIKNQTASTAEPVPFAEFATLPDPDRDNHAAFSSLFQ